MDSTNGAIMSNKPTCSGKRRLLVGGALPALALATLLSSAASADEVELEIILEVKP